MAGMLSTRQAAEFLGLEEATLRGWRCEDIGPPYHRLSPRSVRYDLSDLQQYKSERRCIPSLRHIEGKHGAV